MPVNDEISGEAPGSPLYDRKQARHDTRIGGPMGVDANPLPRLSTIIGSDSAPRPEPSVGTSLVGRVKSFFHGYRQAAHLAETHVRPVGCAGSLARLVPSL